VVALLLLVGKNDIKKNYIATLFENFFLQRHYFTDFLLSLPRAFPSSPEYKSNAKRPPFRTFNAQTPRFSQKKCTFVADSGNAGVLARICGGRGRPRSQAKQLNNR